MTSSIEPQISQLFQAALALPPEQRSAFLAEACAGDEQLSQELAARLAAHEASLNFSTAPTLAQVAEAAGLVTEKLATHGHISHYEIVAPLGAGGMGEVYLATDTRLSRKVALKFLPAQFTTDTERVRRFIQEARAASALNHPHVITIYDIGQAPAGHYIVMEFVEGQTLRAQMKQLCPPHTIALLGAQIAQALASAHEAGITHRDIKPENIMVRRDGYVKVLDFGLARLAPAASTVDSEVATLAHTQPGMLLGTVQYMSPEQARGEAVLAASDVFSLGLVLYEMATGHAPFTAETVLATLNAIASQQPLPPSHWQADLPAALEQLLLQMLEKDPHQRPSAAVVAAALQELGSLGGRASGGLAERTQGQSAVGARARARAHVGREKEAAELRTGYGGAAAGQGLLVSVAGEPGIGKTTLIEHFLEELNTASPACLKARGRCSERLAGTEAYLPWLEALERLLRDYAQLELGSRGGETVAQLMRRLAPTWYAQVAPLTDDTPSPQSPSERAGTQERLKRELYALLRELSAWRPLVLFLDDLHWADASTVDLLGYLAGRFEGTRLLLLVSYRPSDLLLAKHPFLKLKPELQTRGVCRELALGFLTYAEVEQYLAQQFPDHQFPAELAQLIHAKTEGNPLFMVDLVRYLRDRQVIAQEQGHWLLVQALPDIAQDLPESVRGMIERKIAELSEQDRQLLVAASVQGYAFDSAVVAKALGLDSAEVEEHLERLEQVYALVRIVKEREFPDGTLTLHLRFVHVLYQNALYASLRATRKAALSRAVAEALESVYGEQSASVANELALLWETARDFQQAAGYFYRAAQNAGHLCAANEAVALAQRGLAALAKLPETRERLEQELLLQLVLGNDLMALKGYAAPEIKETYGRAREICQRLGETPYLLPATYGFYILHQVRTELSQALELGEELLRLAERRGGPELIVGHWVVGIPLVYMGKLDAARQQFEQVLALYDPAQHRPLTWLYAHEPGMLGHIYLALTLWLLGYPAQAVTHIQQALTLSNEVAHAHSQVFAYSIASVLYQLMDDKQQIKELADATQVLSDKHGLIFWAASARVWRAWVQADQGQFEAGISDMRMGMEMRRLTGVEVWRVYSYYLLAETYGKAGQPAAGLAVLPGSREERFMIAEVYRLRGALLLQQGASAAAVEPHFQRALEVARAQQAKSLELRAALSLSRLWHQQGKPTEARTLLAEVYGWFTEGFETADLRAARALLDQF
jgi:predicted ATPase